MDFLSQLAASSLGWSSGRGQVLVRNILRAQGVDRCLSVLACCFHTIQLWGFPVPTFSVILIFSFDRLTRG